MTIDRMGVLVIMAHLIITVLMFVLYGFLVYLDKPVTDISNMLLLALGYWFGAIGKEAIRPNGRKAEQTEQTEAPKKEDETL